MFTKPYVVANFHYQLYWVSIHFHVNARQCFQKGLSEKENLILNMRHMFSMDQGPTLSEQKGECLSFHGCDETP